MAQYWITFYLIPVMAVCSLHLLDVSVPPMRLTGQTAKLFCRYEMNDDPLYSIKWYKDGKEFYRYVPNDYPPLQAFPVPGINVDINLSDQYYVTLTQLSLASTGRYKCEVSADAPSFQTLFLSADMTVVALPHDGPRITTTIQQLTMEQVGNESYRAYYKVNNKDEDSDVMEFNCTSNPSKPVAALQWYINGAMVPTHDLIEYAPVPDEDANDAHSKLETSLLGLRKRLTLFDDSNDRRDSIVLNCTASVGSIYWSSASVTVIRNTQEDKTADKAQRMVHRESHLSDGSCPLVSKVSPIIGIVPAVFISLAAYVH